MKSLSKGNIILLYRLSQNSRDFNHNYSINLKSMFFLSEYYSLLLNQDMLQLNIHYLTIIIGTYRKCIDINIFKSMFTFRLPKDNSM